MIATNFRSSFDEIAVGQFFTCTNPLEAILFQKTDSDDGYKYWKEKNGEAMSDDTFSDSFKNCYIVRKPGWLPANLKKIWGVFEAPENGLYKIDPAYSIEILGLVKEYFDHNRDLDSSCLLCRVFETQYCYISYSSWASFMKDVIDHADYCGVKHAHEEV